MAEIARNPLSCTRCKAKKIKCGKEEPVCDKCSSIQAECFYPTRRQKARTAKRRANVLSEILHRLDNLEKKIGVSSLNRTVAGDALSRGGQDGSVLDDDGDEDDEDDEGGTESDGTRTEKETPFKGLYQLMDEAASTTKNVFDNVPEDAPPDQDADALFSDALTSIRNFRWKDSKSSGKPEKLDIADDVAYRWIDLCFQLTFYEQIIGSTNKNLMMAMPHIMKSPAVSTHYSVIVVYYNVLFCGWRSDRQSSTPELKTYGRKIYRECLKILPAWKNDGLPATIMDFIGTGLMTIMAIENFDYHLAWDLHLACCAIARELKLDKLDDADPDNRPAGYENEDDRDVIRKKIWQLIHMEFFFRLYYDKPASMTGSDFSVNLPSITPSPDSPHSADAIYFLVSSRIVFITKEFFDFPQKPEADFKVKVKSLADQMENALLEWKIDDLLTNSNEDSLNKWMYADLLVNGYITIILMERKTLGSGDKTQPPSARSVVAARRALETINSLSTLFGHDSPTFINFISFYPFIAFFTLYHHILFSIHQRQKTGNNQLGEIEGDIQLMEDLTGLLTALATYQDEFRLVAGAVTALTKASHHMITTSLPNTPLSTAKTPPTTRNLRPRQQSNVQKAGSELVKAPEDFTFTWTEMNSPGWPQLEAGLHQHGLQTPLLYVESMESDLFGKNWHQSWWDQ